MKKKVFRERYNDFQEQIIKKQFEKVIEEAENGMEIMKKAKEGTLEIGEIKKPTIVIEEKPKKRGRRRSVK